MNIREEEIIKWLDDRCNKRENEYKNISENEFFSECYSVQAKTVWRECVAIKKDMEDYFNDLKRNGVD